MGDVGDMRTLGLRRQEHDWDFPSRPLLVLGEVRIHCHQVRPESRTLVGVRLGGRHGDGGVVHQCRRRWVGLQVPPPRRIDVTPTVGGYNCEPVAVTVVDQGNVPEFTALRPVTVSTSIGHLGLLARPLVSRNALACMPLNALVIGRMAGLPIALVIEL